MRNDKLILFLFLLAYLFFFSISLHAAPQIKHHAIDINLTYGSHVKTEMSIPWLNSFWSGNNTGFSGKVGYDILLSDNLALTASFGVLYSREMLSVASYESTSLKNLMLGVKYYIPKISDDSVFRLFLCGAAGMALGSENVVNVSSPRSFSQNIVMYHLGGGCDFVLGSLIKLTAGLGYNFLDDFSDPIGTVKNFSGLQTSLGIGFMF